MPYIQVRAFPDIVRLRGLTALVLAGFLFYCAAVAIFSSVMIYKVAPKHGKKNPLIFISICSTVGSVSVMSVKAFGIALKLTLNGNNQLTHPSTYAFAIVTVCCILTQMNYFNKALSQFSTSMYALSQEHERKHANGFQVSIRYTMLPLRLSHWLRLSSSSGVSIPLMQ